ncbi:MAG: hypothetical protein H5T97_06270, partial [Firmicutes bacterium]|nr:hypothetical protein [Bacillota bacterium]
VESAEQLHEDSFFNEFLTIYLKYKLDLKGSYYNNVELQKPFQSHEIDAVLQLKNKIIMFETSIEFEIKPDNLKKKIYNLWSLHQYFEKAVTFYLTFGKIQDNTTKSFFEFHNQNTTKTDPHFEILHFPSTLKDIEYLLKDINKPSDLNNLQKKIKNDFIEFLHELEQKVRSYLKIPTAKY